MSGHGEVVLEVAGEVGLVIVDEVFEGADELVLHFLVIGGFGVFLAESGDVGGGSLDDERFVFGLYSLGDEHSFEDASESVLAADVLPDLVMCGDCVHFLNLLQQFAHLDWAREIHPHAFIRLQVGVIGLLVEDHLDDGVEYLLGLLSELLAFVSHLHAKAVVVFEVVVSKEEIEAHVELARQGVDLNLVIAPVFAPARLGQQLLLVVGVGELSELDLLIVPLGSEEPREADEGAVDLDVAGDEVALDFADDGVVAVEAFAIEDAGEGEGGGVDLGEVVVVVEGELVEFVEEGEFVGVVEGGGLYPVHGLLLLY